MFSKEYLQKLNQPRVREPARVYNIKVRQLIFQLYGYFLVYKVYTYWYIYRPLKEIVLKVQIPNYILLKNYISNISELLTRIY